MERQEFQILIKNLLEDLKPTLSHQAAQYGCALTGPAGCFGHERSQKTD